jgi:hypothetical protein
MKNHIASYEVEWVVKATLTNNNGDAIDGYEYSTIEPRDLIEKRYPNLVRAFQAEETEQQKQGDAEQVRRFAFLENIIRGVGAETNNEEQGKRRKKDLKKRERYFHKRSDSRKHPTKKLKMSHRLFLTSDIMNLLGTKTRPIRSPKCRKSRRTVVPKSSWAKNDDPCHQNDCPKKHETAINHTQQPCIASIRKQTTDMVLNSPGSAMYCDMGAFMIEVSPVASHKKDFPPKHIFVHIRAP